MAWVPGNDYPSAQQQVGYPVSVLDDGTDTGATPLSDNGAVIGWRSGCGRGWRGRQFYPRAEWPSDSGAVPAVVEGWDGITATCGEWVRLVGEPRVDDAAGVSAKALTFAQAHALVEHADGSTMGVYALVSLLTGPAPRN